MKLHGVSGKQTNIDCSDTCRRVYILAYNVNETILDRLTFPKARSGGEHFEVSFMAAAFDSRVNSGEFYLGFKQQVHCKLVVRAFEEAGARSLMSELLASPNPKQPHDVAANALLRIWETAFNAGVELIVRGECPSPLLRHTVQKWKVSHPTLQPMIVPANHQAEHLHQKAVFDAMGEFDVVKKRRIMDEYDGSDNDDDDPERLLQFEEFEDATMQALMEALDIDDKRTHEEDMLQFESTMVEAMLRGETIPMTGGVYIAKNASLDGILKIGATRRHPRHRLYELSRSSPTPFELVVFFPSMTPFNMEKMIHAYLATCRIKNQGAGTEFFRMAATKISVMTTTLNLPPPVFA
jgi:hypothetical protein